MFTQKNIPDFLVIGSQKCATSWLYDCLSEHPQICMPRHKREIEYIGGQLYKEKGIDWYLSLLNHCNGEKMKGDVSVEYIVNDESPRLLFELNPNLKFILSVRNPVDRAMSALNWYTRKGVIKDNQNAIKKEVKQAIDAFEHTSYALMNYGFHDILYRGLYSKLLEKYYVYFKKENILIVHYEDIKKSPEAVLNKIFSFLNVDQNFVLQNIKTQPKKNSNNRFLIKIERMFPKSKIVSYSLDKLHQKVPEKKSISQFERDIRYELEDFYANHKNYVTV